MVTIEQKLSLFSKLLQQDLKDAHHEEMTKLEAEYSQKLLKNKEVVDKKAREIIDAARTKGKTKKVEMVSKAKMEIKKQGLLAKEKHIADFMGQLTERIKAFTHTQEYMSYMDGLVGGCKELKDTTGILHVYVTPGDYKSFEKHLLQQFEKLGMNKEAIQIVEGNELMIGGMIIENPTEKIRVDLSIAAVLSDRKDEIIARIFEVVGEVGDLVE